LSKGKVIQFPVDDGQPRDLASTIERRRKAMTVKEVADVLGVSDKQIYSLVSRSLIPYFRVGGALRFDPFAIAAWLRKQQAAA
jgi:excisionase family DNA binding protein